MKIQAKMHYGELSYIETYELENPSAQDLVTIIRSSLNDYSHVTLTSSKQCKAFWTLGVLCLEITSGYVVSGGYQRDGVKANMSTDGSHRFSGNLTLK